MAGVTEADFQELRDELRAFRVEVEADKGIATLITNAAEERLDYLEEQRRLGLQREGERVDRIKGLEDLTQKQSNLIRQLRTDLESANRAAGGLLGRIQSLEALAQEVREREAVLLRRMEGLETLTQAQQANSEGDGGRIDDLQAQVRRLRGLTDRKAYLEELGLGGFGEKAPKGHTWDCRYAAEGGVGREQMEAIVAGINLTGVNTVIFEDDRLAPAALPPLLRLLNEPHAGGVRKLCLGGNPLLLSDPSVLGEAGLPPALTRLYFGRCGLTPDSLHALLEPGLLPPGLTHLSLRSNPECGLSDVWLMEAMGASEGLPLGLTWFRVSISGVTSEGAEALRRLRPQLQIIWEEGPHAQTPHHQSLI